MITDFRTLCAELIKIVEEHCNPDEYALLDVVNVLSRARTALATTFLPPEPTTSQITFNDSPTEEIIRLDKEGFHYKGQFIADAGEAHRLMLAYLKQHVKVEQEPPTTLERSTNDPRLSRPGSTQ